MQSKTPPIYVPALRLKAGEYRALARLARSAPDVADRIAPRLVLPPPGERDPEEKRVLTKDEILHKTGERVGRHWPLRTAFLDPSYLLDSFGDEDCAIWLPRIFDVARRHNALPVPIAALKDVTGARADAFRQSVSPVGQAKIAIRVRSAEIDHDFHNSIGMALSAFDVRPEECGLLLDFSDANFSDVTAIAEFSVGAMEAIQDAGLWNSVIFQGTNYPEKNPAEADSIALVNRNEWLAWKMAVEADDIASRGLTFGDYCADSAKFVFGSRGRAAPIRHFRYTTDLHWLVVRGKPDVLQIDAMKSVSERILASGKFAGRDFSSADNYIYETAEGSTKGGNATTWREINTAHHITQVVSDIGRMRGFEIKRHAVSEPQSQGDMFSLALDSNYVSTSGR